MDAIDILRSHAAELEAASACKIQVVGEGQRLFVVVEKFPLPPGRFRLAATDLLLITDHQYPYSAMDMFWTELDVIYADGRLPKQSEVLESHLGRSWRRFSWHPNQTWNPNGNPLMDHFAFVESRFASNE